MNSSSFQSINKAYNSIFKTGEMSIGLVMPIENHDANPVPEMLNHLERVQLAEKLGFKAIWLRDIPFNVTSFRDAGQTYDPFVYLGYLAGQTNEISLGIASIILPLRHPAHVAKAAISTDILSNGRLLLGIASGDRPEEYPALNVPYENRSLLFRESYDYIQQMGKNYPAFDNHYGYLRGNADMLPKPKFEKLPLLIAGGSQQSQEWIAQHGDGWMLYPRNARIQLRIITDWQERIAASGQAPKPIMEPFYLDLVEDDDSPPTSIHLGLRLGSNYLIDYLHSRRDIGVNHVAINLRFNKANIEKTLEHLASKVLSVFHTKREHHD